MALHLIWTVQERQCWLHPEKEKAFKQIHYQNATDMQYSSPLIFTVHYSELNFVAPRSTAPRYILLDAIYLYIWNIYLYASRDKSNILLC